MIVHSRLVPSGAGVEVFAATETHIRQHLSAVADPDDDPASYAALVRVTRHQRDDGVLLVGELDAEPQADYLADDYDPYDGVPDELRAEASR
jgi:hypothetical protein